MKKTLLVLMLMVAMSLSLSTVCAARTFVFGIIPGEDPLSAPLNAMPGDVLHQPRHEGNLDVLTRDIKNPTTQREAEIIIDSRFDPGLSIWCTGCDDTRFSFTDEWLCIFYNWMHANPQTHFYPPAHIDNIRNSITHIGQQGTREEVGIGVIGPSEAKFRERPPYEERHIGDDDPDPWDPGGDIPAIDDLSPVDTLIVWITAVSGEDDQGRLFLAINPLDRDLCDSLGTYSRLYLDSLITWLTDINAGTANGAEMFVNIQTSWSRDFVDAFEAAFPKSMGIGPTETGEIMQPTDGFVGRNSEPEAEWRCNDPVFSMWDDGARYATNFSGFNFEYRWIGNQVANAYGSQPHTLSVNCERAVKASCYWTSQVGINTPVWYVGELSTLGNTTFYKGYNPHLPVAVTYNNHGGPPCIPPEGYTWVNVVLTNPLPEQSWLTTVTTEPGITPTERPVSNYYYDLEYGMIQTGEPCYTMHLDSASVPINKQVYLSSGETVEVQTRQALPEGISEIHCLVPYGEDTYFQIGDKYRFSEAYPLDPQTILSSYDNGDDQVDGVLSTEGPNASAVPNEYALHQNYPNPFNPTTTIRYDLKESGSVSLKVFDLLGREVITLVDGQHSAGGHSVIWDATGSPSGIYICRMDAGNFSQTRKLLLVK